MKYTATEQFIEFEKHVQESIEIKRAGAVNENTKTTKTYKYRTTALSYFLKWTLQALDQYEGLFSEKTQLRDTVKDYLDMLDTLQTVCAKNTLVKMGSGQPRNKRKRQESDDEDGKDAKKAKSGNKIASAVDNTDKTADEADKTNAETDKTADEADKSGDEEPQEPGIPGPADQ